MVLLFLISIVATIYFFIAFWRYLHRLYANDPTVYTAFERLSWFGIFLMFYCLFVVNTVPIGIFFITVCSRLIYHLRS